MSGERQVVKPRILIVVICAIAACILCSGCSSKLAEKHQEQFNNAKVAFNEIKELVLSAVKADENANADFDETGRISYSVCHKDDVEGSEIVGLYEFPIAVADKQVEYLNVINDLMGKDFEAIWVFENRISFLGDGHNLYVYSFDGAKPEFYHFPDDGVRFNVQNLGDNWFYLHANLR